MGYEVLDANGDTVDRRLAPAADDDPAAVVDLCDDVPDAAKPTNRRPAARRTPLLVVAALLVGVIAGGALSRYQSGRADDEAMVSVLSVAAQTDEVQPFALPIGLGARLQVVVTNLGPLRVDVVASERGRPDGSRGARTSRVTVLGVGTSVAPGTSVRVEIRLPVDCRSGRVITTTLPVRTSDGVIRDVPVTVPNGGRPPVSVCPPIAGPAPVRATLVGTVALPAVQLANNTNEVMRVQLPLQALSPQSDVDAIDVVTNPALPTTIRPHDRLTVRLRFIPRRCVADLTDLQRLDIASLAITPVSLGAGRPVQGDDFHVDVTAVVVAAMVRICG